MKYDSNYPKVLDRTQDNPSTSLDKTLDRLSDDTRVRVLKEFIIELIEGGYGSKKPHIRTIYTGGGSSSGSSDAILMDNPTQS